MRKESELLSLNQLKTMKTTTIVLYKNENQNNMYGNVQHMTSLEIAELTGKQHKNVMQAIRNMEPAWEKTCGLKFQLTSRTIVQPNGGTREVPCYSLTKTECLYIATKFNDEARAKLVLRWEELERADVRSKMADVRCTLRHCCVTFFVKDLFKCKKRSTFVTVCCNVFTLLVYI